MSDQAETLPPDALRVPPLCEHHQYDLIRRRLKMGEADPWRVAIVTANILTFQQVTALPAIQQMAGGTAEGLKRIVESIRCLACYHRPGYRAAVRVLRKGLSHAAKVARGEINDPDHVPLQRSGDTP